MSPLVQSAPSLHMLSRRRRRIILTRPHHRHHRHRRTSGMGPITPPATMTGTATLREVACLTAAVTEGPLALAVNPASPEGLMSAERGPGLAQGPGPGLVLTRGIVFEVV